MPEPDMLKWIATADPSHRDEFRTRWDARLADLARKAKERPDA